MRKGKKVLLLVICLAAVFVLAVYLIRGREPHYQGRSLTEWLLLHYDSCHHKDNPQAEADTQRAEQAVRFIGTNALPYLLKWIRDEPPPSRWRTKARSLRRYLPTALEESDLLEAMLTDKADTRFHVAVEGFAILGPQAAPAIPELTSLMNNWHKMGPSHQAMESLAFIGSEGLPPLLATLTNSHYPYRSGVASCLGAMSYRIGTNIAPAVPLLVQCANETNSSMVEAATDALGYIALEPDISLPPLLRALGSSNMFTRWRAARRLSRFGAQARPAVPALQAALNDTNSTVRYCATNALLQIAPEVLTNTPAQ